MRQVGDGGDLGGAIGLSQRGRMNPGVCLFSWLCWQVHLDFGWQGFVTPDLFLLGSRSHTIALLPNSLPVPKKVHATVMLL